MSPLCWIFYTFCFLEGAVAIFLNGFIVFFHGRSLREGGRRNPLSLIHIIMGIDKMAMQCVWTVKDVALWFPEIFDTPVNHKIFYFLITFCLHFSYWLTAWLSVYHSIFIANFSHQKWVWIKRNLLAFLPQVLSLTCVGSLVTSGLYMRNSSFSSNAQYSMNGTQSVSAFLPSVSGVYSVIIFGYCLPFTVIVIFLLISVFSLMKHVSNVSQAGMNVQVHATLIKTMVAFVLLGLISFMCYMVHFITKYKSKDPSSVITEFLLMTVPTIETIIIIRASPKLRKHFLWLFCIRRVADA